MAIEKHYVTQQTLQWRHNEHDGVSNHRRLGYLLNRLFMQRSNKTSQLCVTGLCEGNSPVTSEFPAQMASNAENVSIWWHHHGIGIPISWGDLTRERGNRNSGNSRQVTCPFIQHADVTKWKHFPRNWPLWGESTGHRWIPCTKTSDVELWRFLWTPPKQTAKQTIEMLVIWDTIALFMTS